MYGDGEESRVLGVQKVVGESDLNLWRNQRRTQGQRMRRWRLRKVGSRMTHVDRNTVGTKYY